MSTIHLPAPGREFNFWTVAVLASRTSKDTWIPVQLQVVGLDDTSTSWRLKFTVKGGVSIFKESEWHVSSDDVGKPQIITHPKTGHELTMFQDTVMKGEWWLWDKDRAMQELAAIEERSNRLSK